MLFPELRSLLKRFLPDSDEPISLGLKDVTFNTVNVDWYARNGFPQLYSILGGGSSAWSGESVTLQTALNHSVVYACKAIICESVGIIPPSVLQSKNGDKRHAEEHPMYAAMKDSPNDEITSQCFREMLTGHCVMGGNGYARIYRRSGTNVANELQPLLPEQVMPDREKTGRKRLVYVLKNEHGATDKTFTVEKGKPQDILHLRGLGWDGVSGHSVIHMARQSIGAAIAAERNVARFWANGGRVPYIIEMEGRFRDDEEFKKFRDDWQQTYAEPGKAPILELGKKYKQIGMSMADSQALEGRQFSIPEIARWFSVSPHLVGDLSRATFSNIEHLTLEFVKMTLTKWLVRWEQSFKLQVLTPEERAQGYTLHHNVNALLRGDFKTRMEGYASALQNGHMNIDEVRELEDRNKLANGAGRHHHIQTNMGTIKAGGQIQPAESSSLVRLDED